MKMSLIFSILTNENKCYTYMNTYKILVLLLIYLKYEKKCLYIHVSYFKQHFIKTNG